MNSAESYKHQFAKATLARWLRDAAAATDDLDNVSFHPIQCWSVNRGSPHYAVWTEYPICLDSENALRGDGVVWDEDEDGNWRDRPPTYDELIKLNLLPIVIFDVAIQCQGSIHTAFEVVHRHGISETKLAYLKRIDIPTYTIDADWILSRSERPEELVCDLVT